MRYDDDTDECVAGFTPLRHANVLMTKIHLSNTAEDETEEAESITVS